MDLQTLVGQWQAVLAAAQRLGGEASPLVVDPPASIFEVEAAERALGGPLPASLRDFLLTCSGRIDFTWTLPEEFPLPDGFSPAAFGSAQLSLGDLAEAEERRREVVDYLETIDADDGIKQAFAGKLAVCLMANGDYLAIDIAQPGDEPVVYIEHENDAMQGYRLASDFQDFLGRWSALGCPGPEWWQWEPFTGGDRGFLDPDGANARLWKRTLGLER